MVDIVQESTLTLLAMSVGSDEAVYAPGLGALVQRLEEIWLDECESQSVECAVRLAGSIQGDLAFIRVNSPVSGDFAGWVVQLSGSEEFNSFALARMDDQATSRLPDVRVVELFSCVDAFDSRCVLTHQELIQWLSHELSGRITSDRYRWIDFSIALKELD